MYFVGSGMVANTGLRSPSEVEHAHDGHSDVDDDDEGDAEDDQHRHT